MRADKYFKEYFGSRSKAQNALGRGLVLRRGKPLSPSDEVREGDEFTFLEGDRFVSNGGLKLEQGLSVFQEDVRGCTVLDLGSSTGGFCDCLLRRGAKKVYCVDVGEGLLDPLLAQDERVVVMDNTNARYLSPADFPEQFDCLTSDLSFISLRLVLPVARELLKNDGRAFVLFKPQFECEGRGLGKSGILPVRFHAELLSQFYDFCTALDFAPANIVNAPVRQKKNIEYIVSLRKGSAPVPKEEFMRRAQNFV